MLDLGWGNETRIVFCLAGSSTSMSRGHLTNGRGMSEATKPVIKHAVFHETSGIIVNNHWNRKGCDATVYYSLFRNAYEYYFLLSSNKARHKELCGFTLAVIRSYYIKIRLRFIQINILMHTIRKLKSKQVLCSIKYYNESCIFAFYINLCIFICISVSLNFP